MIEGLPNIGEALVRVARERATAPAVVSLERSISYVELERLSAQIAHSLLADGLAPGQSTALIASGIPYVAGYFGIVRAGNRAVPVEARFRGEQLRRILRSTAAMVVLTDHSASDALTALGEPDLRTVDLLALLERGPSNPPPLPDVDPDAELCVLFSSGSTGFPKGVVLTHRAGLGRAALMARVFGPAKRHLVFTPLAYAYGLIDGTLCPLLHGGQTLLLGTYNPARLSAMAQKFDPEVVLGVPFVYKHLGSMASDLFANFAGQKKCLYYTTGEPLPRAVMEAFSGRYGVPIRQSYGLSETSGISADLHDVEPRPGRVGKLIPGVKIRLVEAKAGELVDAPIGELWVVRSHRFMKGYVEGTESADERLKADHYRTGDLAHVDEDGYLELYGRNDDFVTVSGVRIHPAEVENVLLSLPGVLEAAFVCERNAETGESTTRCYVVLDPARPQSVADLEAKVHAELPRSRWPQQIEISAGLPRTDTGKLVRRSLAERKDERLVARAPVEIEVDGQRHPGRLVDVSRNGCALETELQVAVGTELRVAIVSLPIWLAGTCRHAVAVATGWRVSIAFLPDTPRAEVERFIAAR